MIIQKQTSDMLKIFFGDVLTATNGKDALEVFRNKSVDIILTDIKMPMMSGLELTQKIRAMDNMIPIILLSSFGDQSTLLEAANCGIDGYILKPIELDNLLDTFDKVLQRKKTKRKYFTFTNGLLYNILTDELYKDNTLVDLGKKERMLLKLFIDNFDKTLSKEEIIYTIWELQDVTESALKNLLNRLRTKLGFDIIISVKGSGWKLNTSQKKE